MDQTGDEAIAATNDDAAVCKYQASLKNYYKDPFICHFLSHKMRTCSTRKAPEINRGYYARSASIAYLVERFLKTYQDSQIISLGAGYDSLYWRLKSSNIIQESHKYIEIDLNLVTIYKIMAIKRHQELSKFLSGVTYKGEALHSDLYHLVSFDLRQVDKTSLKTKLIEDCKLDLSKPTLCIAECVLVYMPANDSKSLVSWFSQLLENLTMITYEQCNMKDRFGEIMLANMTERHCDLLGVEVCQDIASQTERFKSNDMAHVRVNLLSEIYEKYLSPTEIERIEKIEFLDEKELLVQLLQHYCIVIASNRELDWLTDQEYWLADSLT